MHGHERTSLSRRRALGAGAVALVAVGLTRTVRVSAQVQGGGGIIGGGLAKLPDGEANIVLAALSQDLENSVEGTEVTSVFGRFMWLERAESGQELTLESTSITGYRYLHNLEHGEGREFYGYLTVNGSGRHPFTAKVIDGGRPGSGMDTISLDVESDSSSETAMHSDFTYSVTGTLTSGGFEVLHLGDLSEYVQSH